MDCDAQRLEQGLGGETVSAAREPAIADITAIVVAYNSSAHLPRCLKEITPAVDQVIVVDNASEDSSAEVVRRSAPTAQLIELSTNVGFGTANNIAMRSASSRYFLLVNPDAWPAADAVRRLVECAERDTRVGIIGPTLVNEDMSFQRSIFGYPDNELSLLAFVAIPKAVRVIYAGWQYGVGWFRRLRRGAREEVVLIGDRQFLAGAALLLRADAVDEVGEFDDRLFLFSEEADLCFRMRESGWLVAFCPAARFVHIGAASSPVSWDWRYAELLRSYLLLLAKRRGLRRAQRARRLLLAVLSARAAMTLGERRRQIRLAAIRLSAPDVLRPMA